MKLMCTLVQSLSAGFEVCGYLFSSTALNVVVTMLIDVFYEHTQRTSLGVGQSAKSGEN